jgi:hypothetical protein
MGRYRFRLALAAALVSALFAGQARAVDLAVDPDLFKPGAAVKPDLGDADALIARAKQSVANSSPTLKQDLDNLFLALLASRDLPDRYNLLDAIGEIGNLRESAAPVAVKAYLQRLALLVFPRLPEEVQSEANLIAGRIFASKKEMQREIGLLAPANRTEEAAGLKLLRARDLGVSYDTLQTAIQTADIDLTQAVLQAGLQVGGANIQSTYDVVSTSLRMACDDPTLAPGSIAKVLDLLNERGYSVNYVDGFGQGLLFSAAQNCPGAVVAHIADLGARVDARDSKGVTPLEMALESDRFDVADVLMGRGAQLSPTAGKRVLFFPRQDARRADYVKRAVKADAAP